MNKLLKLITEQITNNTLDYNKINEFFKSLNDFLKGDATSSIYVKYTPQTGHITTNINGFNDVLTQTEFKTTLTDYITNFEDNTELLFDILELANNYGLFKLSQPIQQYLLYKVFNTGLYCYVPIDLTDWLDNWDYIKYDINIIAGIITDNTTLTDINNELLTIQTEFYSINNPLTLKEQLI